MRVGTRIREILAIAETLDTVTNTTMCPLVPHIERSNVGKYLRRAVGMGLMTIDRSVIPHRFATVPGWQDRVGSTTRLSKPKPAPIYKPRPCALQDAWRMQA